MYEPIPVPKYKLNALPNKILYKGQQRFVILKRTLMINMWLLVCIS
jgi:hypothetical protein